MPITALDSLTALMVVDLQQGIIGSQFIHPRAEVINRTRFLIEAFRGNELPSCRRRRRRRSARPNGTTETHQTLPEGWTDIISELDLRPGDILVTKETGGAFAGTDLEAGFKKNDVAQVVITGAATLTGVESTAPPAYEQGFNVTLAIDAMTDVRPEAHADFVTRVFPRPGETGTTQQIIDLVAARSI